MKTQHCVSLSCPWMLNVVVYRCNSESILVFPNRWYQKDTGQKVLWGTGVGSNLEPNLANKGTRQTSSQTRQKLSQIFLCWRADAKNCERHSTRAVDGRDGCQHIFPFMEKYPFSLPQQTLRREAWKYKSIYPSHGYTALVANEICKKYQAILACWSSLGTYRCM